MNQILEFKKDCIMKTYVDEVTDITLTHDYKVLEDTIEGYFDVSGNYKMSKSSIQNEEFMFTIPFTIALSSLIDKSSIDIKIEDFKYFIEKDVIHLDMFLEMTYQEITNEELNIEKGEDMGDLIDSFVDEKNVDKILEESGTELSNDIAYNENTTNEINSILNFFSDDKNFYSYKIYIMRKEDTLESIAIKYNVSLNDLKEYNNIENLKVGDKIIIPYIKINDKE